MLFRSPLNKANASATFDVSKTLSFLVREHWYGKVLSAGSTATTDQVLSAKFLTDVEAVLKPRKGLTLAVGANNVFNVYPDKMNAANNTTGLTQYSSFSPFGYNGGFYYLRVSYTH